MGLIKEVKFAIEALKLSKLAKKYAKDTSENFIVQFEAIADKHKNHEAIVFEGETWLYKDLEARANRYAHWVKAQNIGTGQVLALLMENRSEYLAAWLGILKSGNTASLINNNLKGIPLSHSINV